MTLLRRHAAFALLLAAMTAGAACDLNPQPLPPDNPSDAGLGTPVASAGDASALLDSGTEFGAPDGSVDGGSDLEPNDGSSDASPNGDGATDGGDAEPPADAEPSEGGETDAGTD